MIACVGLHTIVPLAGDCKLPIAPVSIVDHCPLLPIVTHCYTVLHILEDYPTVQPCISGLFGACSFLQLFRLNVEAAVGRNDQVNVPFLASMRVYTQLTFEIYLCIFWPRALKFSSQALCIMNCHNMFSLDVLAPDLTLVMYLMICLLLMFLLLAA